MNRIYVLLILGAIVVLTPAYAPGCGGGYDARPTFFSETALNVAADDVLAGRLGVVLPGIWIRHLAVAYRYLGGPPPRLASRDENHYSTAADSGVISPDAWKRWLDLRATVTPGKAPREPSRTRVLPDSNFGGYPNCSTGAIESAAETLENRIASFGAAHTGIRSWVAAQDVVFDNCTSGVATPAEPEPELPPVLAADRQHQMAAADFYAGRLDLARDRWLRVARDEQSPWRNKAPYFAARCLIRKSTLDTEDLNEPLMRKAAEELEALGSQSRDKTVRAWSTSLAEYARGRVDPYGTMAILGARISDPAQDGRFSDNVDQFDYLYVTRGSKLQPKGANDFTDWILAARQKMSSEETVAHWRKTRSLPWLLWALAAIGPQSENRAELIRVATSIPSNSPAFATATFHRVRLAMADGDPDSARSLLDNVLPDLRRTQPITALNPFLAWRLAVARNYDEFLRYSVRQQIDLAPGRADGFDTDVTGVFNWHLSHSLWRRAAASPFLPARRAQAIRRTLWVRAVLSGDYTLAVALSPQIRKTHPRLQATLQAFENATSPEEHQFTAAYALMKTNLQPALDEGDSYEERTENERLFGWTDWCSVDRPGEPGQPPLLPWLSAADGRQATAELARMRAQGAASNFFARAVIAWAKTHPDDPRAPEALHLTVRATRYGCHDSETGRYSRAAFALLHKQYPDSKWARKTKYWFGNPL